MSQYNRAAQFSPFAALTGHEAAIQETARLTEAKLELSEDEKYQLDEQLRVIMNLLEQNQRHPEVSITYFEADAYKAGGAYHTVQGIVRKVDTYQQCILLENGMQIAISDVYALEVVCKVNV